MRFELSEMPSWQQTCRLPVEGKMESDDDDDLPTRDRNEETIKETLQRKRIELATNLAIVDRTLAMMGGNKNAEELYHAITEALDL